MPLDSTSEPYQITVALEAVEMSEDHLVFPGGVLLPLSARGSGVLGMPDRPLYGQNKPCNDQILYSPVITSPI